jgi:hypothetical protein
MMKLDLLNTERHKNQRIIRDFRPGLTYDQGAVMVLPCEIQQAQREYPILFRKHSETGRLFPNALLGFEEHENLFLSDDGSWRGHYVPLSFAKGPFYIGFEQQERGGQKPVISLDLEDPRVSDTEGDSIFLPTGDLAPYMRSINDSLSLMHEDYSLMRKMVDTFLQADLIEPLNIDITLDNGEQINFAGAYTIAEEKLRALDGPTLTRLNSQGYLSAAYYIAGSLDNIKRLIDMKNQNLQPL